jgi:hypothetical protein
VIDARNDKPSKTRKNAPVDTCHPPGDERRPLACDPFDRATASSIDAA